MASIRKRGNRYLIVVSMGYTPDGRRRNPQQKNDQAARGKKHTMMPKSARTDA